VSVASVTRNVAVLQEAHSNIIWTYRWLDTMGMDREKKYENGILNTYWDIILVASIPCYYYITLYLC
jgi:hypothetical protein